MKFVESVVESRISVLEHHSSKSRNLSEDMIETEMSVPINRPAVQHSKSVTESMKKYWDGKKVKDRYFVRKYMNIKSYFVSMTVDGLKNTQKKNSLMLCCAPRPVLHLSTES